jgi:SWI/SNF-related matrix-associated actin-dependent regulator of chromatin subfamily A3
MYDASEAHRQLCTQRLIDLMQSSSLRRTRELLDLPDITDVPRHVQLSPPEWKQYNTTKDAMNRRLRIGLDESGSVSKFGMFQIQLQLRLLCNHGTWQHHFHWARADRLDEKEDALCSLGFAGEVRCSACLQLVPLIDSNSVYRNFRSSCTHKLCSDCLLESRWTCSDNNDTQNCPQCVATGVITWNIDGSSEQQSEEAGYFRKTGVSSKIEALLVDISQDLEDTIKYELQKVLISSLLTRLSVVFSCWTHTLDLIAQHFQANNLDFRRIDGNTPVNERQNILDGFKMKRKSKPKIRILLMTTGTGALG